MKHSNTTEASAVDSIALMESAVAIVKAYLQNNQVPHERVPDFIREVYSALSSPAATSITASDTLPAAGDFQMEDASPVVAQEVRTLSKVPFVPIEQSIKGNVLVCLFDGVEKQMLKRHLRAKYGMEWNEYKAHFNLPADYPSVAPGYAETKRQEALKIGLGSKIDKTPKTAVKEVREPLAVAA